MKKTEQKSPPTTTAVPVSSTISSSPASFLSKIIITFLILILVALSYLVMAYVSSPKAVASGNQIILPKVTPFSIVWPSYGQSAVGADGFGVVATNGSQTAHPIASIAKLILAMSVLNKYPLTAGQIGPTIVITQDDVNLYNTDLAQDGSVVPVNVGEQLTEYQALQALLIASGDNIADTLAIWAFGSTDNYIKYANQMVADMNLKETHVADPSGLSPQTVSSAENLVILGEKELKSPVLTDIVSQSTATIPVVGMIKNYDTLLGSDGVVGIKTGNTIEAGGCFLFAVKNPANPNEPTIVGSILGAKDIRTALNDSRTFIKTNINSFVTVSVLQTGQIIGTYDTPWGQRINAVAQKDLTMFTVAGEKISPVILLQDIKESSRTGAQIGSVTATAGLNSETIPVVLDSELITPTFSWRLKHPFVVFRSISFRPKLSPANWWTSLSSHLK